MRILFALPILLAAACDVDNDPANDQVVFQYNEEQAQNTLEAAGETAENIGGAIANDVSETGGRIQNEVGEVDVDVTRNESGNQQ